MKLYAHFGHKEFILCLGYKGEVIKEYFRNYHWNTSDVTLRLGRNPQIVYHNQHDEEDWTVTLLDTGLETQTGGRLQRALAFIKEETFLFTYGDGLTDSDLNRSIDFHRQHGAVATLTAVKPTGRFGELALDDQTITAFREKPEKDNGLHQRRLFVFNKAIGKYLGGDSCVLEKEAHGTTGPRKPVEGVLSRRFLAVHDTYREQELLNRLWNSSQAPWKVW